VSKSNKTPANRRGFLKGATTGHQEVMGLQGLANRYNRGIDNIGIGTKIYDPFIDYAKVAQGLGVQAEGPISDPKFLAAAIARGMEVVKRGDPYLIDTVTQPR
jgi:acetolactate synthase I/II/III large subunit